MLGKARANLERTGMTASVDLFSPEGTTRLGHYAHSGSESDAAAVACLGGHRGALGASLGASCCLQLRRSLQDKAYRWLLDRRHPNSPYNGIRQRPASPEKSGLPAFFLSNVVWGHPWGHGHPSGHDAPMRGCPVLTDSCRSLSGLEQAHRSPCHRRHGSCLMQWPRGDR